MCVRWKPCSDTSPYNQSLKWISRTNNTPSARKAKLKTRWKKVKQLSGSIADVMDLKPSRETAGSKFQAEMTEYDNYTTDRNSRYDNYMIDRNSRNAIIMNMTADAVSLQETAVFISYQEAIISSTPGMRSLPGKLPRCLEL